MVRPQKRANKLDDVKRQDFVELIDFIRNARNKKRVSIAYDEVVTRMHPRLQQIAFKFNIPGMNNDDIYQEALFALRYKAIKDYDPERGNDSGPYPFDKFAVLCIRRHLATILKASYQNKKKVLNQSISLDQERNDKLDDVLFLSDILPSTSQTVLEHLEEKEYYRTLFSKLFAKLSEFERQVFVLYIKKYSYEEIAVKINKVRRKNKTSRINVKSIDNSLSRIKGKAKYIFRKYG